MTYTVTYTHPLSAAHLHGPCTGCTAHAHHTYTRTYTTYTRQGIYTPEGVINNPWRCTHHPKPRSRKTEMPKPIKAGEPEPRKLHKPPKLYKP
jgi:hypothetical protein